MKKGIGILGIYLIIEMARFKAILHMRNKMVNKK